MKNTGLIILERTRNAKIDIQTTLGKAWTALWEWYTDDLIGFVQDQCHIEDKDAPEIVVPFRLWPAQVEVLKAYRDHKFNIVLKARQLGFSWLSLCYAAWVLIRTPGAQVIALSRTEEEAKELVRRMGVILGHMPELLRSKPWVGGVYHVKTLEATVELCDKVSVFKAFPSAAQAARSFTGNLLLLDEWAFQAFAHEIWQATFPVINRPTGGQVIGLSTIKVNTLFTEIWEGDNDFNKIFVPWTADPRRTPEWYQKTARQLGEAVRWEYPLTVEDAFSSPIGKFFPEMCPYHLTDTRPAGVVRRYVSIDYGLDALAALFYEVDPQGRVTVYKEVYKSGLIVSEAAHAVKAALGGQKTDAVYAPPDLWNRNRDTGRSTAEIFAAAGVPLCKTSNERVQGWMDVKEWLKVIETKDEQTGDLVKRPYLQIIKEGAPNLWRCLNAIQVDENNPNDAANDPHELTHLPDSLRAFCAGRPLPAVAPVEHDEDYIGIDDQIDNFINYGG